MERVWIAIVIGVAAVAIAPVSACKGGGGGVEVVAGAPAGDVTEVAGDVKATRDGKTRALAKGDVVAGDDVIATGADGRVTIVLRHNGVPWSLGPNLSKKVSDSAAWTAAKGAAPEAVTDDHSAAAGRHAERSATDTTTSAGSSAESERQLAQAEDDEERAKVKAQLEAAQKQQQETEGIRALGHHGDHTPQKCDPNDPLCGLDDGDVGAPGGGGEVEGSIDHDAVRAVFRAHAGDFKRCYEQLLKTAPDAKGKLALRVTIAPSGKVSSAPVDGDAALEPMKACVQKAAMTLVFASWSGTGSVSISYPLVFSGQ